MAGSEAMGVENFACFSTSAKHSILNFKAGVNVKAALTSLNTAFLPISRSHFKRR